MSKLAAEEKFFDFSDYGRPIAKLFVNQLKIYPGYSYSRYASFWNLWIDCHLLHTKGLVFFSWLILGA